MAQYWKIVADELDEATDQESYSKGGNGGVESNG